jgi:prepilin-type N-terminal cleavage/methylation domain-containing protein/prepilin-type processing-associated H-X9-DG protein
MRSRVSFRSSNSAFTLVELPGDELRAMSKRERKGFTLVELLVVIAIIGILVALLLPAIQAAREAARRAECQSHLKNIALALLNHESARKRFPTGFVSQPGNVEAWVWATFALPYLEEQGIYDRLRPSDTYLTPVSGTRTGQRNLADLFASNRDLEVLQTPLPIFRCPSDSTPALVPKYTGSLSTILPCNPGRAVETDNFERHFNGANSPNGFQVSTSNYVGSKGTIDSDCPFGDAERCANTGIFWGNSKVALKQITDGTTKTFLVGERDRFCLAATWIGARNPPGPDAWSSNWALAHVASPHGKPQYPCTGNHNTCAESFSSPHSGGGFFAFCDGSVHFVSEDVSFDNAGQIDSDANGTVCWANPRATAAPGPCKPQIGTRTIGVYQRLAWRNDGMEIDDTSF